MILKRVPFLGKGAFGSVFEVEIKQDENNNYALKQQPGAVSECIENPDCDVIKEIEILKYLSSRDDAENYIATLQRPYPNYHNSCYDMLMPKADMDLTTFLTKIKTQEIREKIFVPFMRQICEAVSFIHGNNIVHKDLKPDNILVYIDKEQITRGKQRRFRKQDQRGYRK